jgi:alpha-1,3/alpha-1,6-mannosyltransferase
VLYTPENEHFGIVPLEAMAAGKPVIACASGGPRESVADGVTGILCEPRPDAFAAAMVRVSGSGKGVARRMGILARQRVEWKFSRKAFGKNLFDVALGGVEEAARRTKERSKRRRKNIKNVQTLFSLVPMCILARAAFDGIARVLGRAFAARA